MRSPDAALVEFRAGLRGGALPPGLSARRADEVARRFAVYRNNVAFGLVEALRRRFPVVEQLVGEAFARAAFGAFAAAHPPQSPLMMQYGARMPDFLAGFPPAACLPYLPDIARIELARGRAYHAADVTPMAAPELAAAAARIGAGPLRLHPSLSVVHSAYPVHSIWAMNQPGAAVRPVDLAQREAVLVARPRLTVVTEAAAPAEAAFVEALASGAAPDAAALRGRQVAPGFDPVPALARLIGAGLIVGLAGSAEERE
jgi:Putative DNA-binding domain